MEGGTDDLATAGVAEAPAELERQPYDDFDRAVIRATQGDLPVVPEPYAAAAAELGITVDALVDHLRGMVDRGLLRRVAAILFHRRAGFSANGMGVWKVPDDKVARDRPADGAFRGISHCYQRPTYADWPYQLFTMAHGRSKEECDAILDAIAGLDARHRGPRDPLQLDRVQEDPPPVLHRRLPRLGARARRRVSGSSTVSLRDTRSAEVYARAVARLPGGVNSPVRAMRAIGRNPIFVERAQRRRRSSTSTATGTSTGSARGAR